MPNFAMLLRTWTLIVPAVCALPSVASAQAANPARPIHMYVGFGAGGMSDLIGRMIAQKIESSLGQSIVTENRAGASGNIAARFVSLAPADGHTILATTTAVAINNTLYKNKGYNTEDLRPVAIVATSPDVVAVHPSHPAKTLKEFLDAGKEKSFTFSSAGTGTGAHIGAEYLFHQVAKVKAVHVPYTSGAQAITAVLGRHVDVMVQTLPPLTAQIQDGKLRALGLASPTRSSVIPDVPTYAEAGVPNVYSSAWVGFFVSSKTPEPIVVKLNAAINDALKTPDVEERFKTIGFERMIRNQPETDAYFKGELERWATMVRAAGLAGSN